MRVSARATAVVTVKLVSGDLGKNVGKAFFTVVIQYHSLSSEMCFPEGGNKKGSCV